MSDTYRFEKLLFARPSQFLIYLRVRQAMHLKHKVAICLGCSSSCGLLTIYFTYLFRINQESDNFI